jgi:hypothetical protein
MDQLDELRAGITSDERQLLTAIWRRYREQRSGMPCRVLHLTFRDLPSRAMLERLGRSAVVTSWESEECYRLTFLGALLTEDGAAVEGLVIRYLDYVTEQCLADPEFSLVRSEAIEAALALATSESRTLLNLLGLSGLQGSGGSSQEGWTTTVPVEVERLVKGEAAKRFVRDRLVKDYRLGLPMSEAAQWANFSGFGAETLESEEFSFVRNPTLRDCIETDWSEVWRVRQAKAWKSCLFLCGSILEGMLLDVLTVRVGDAKASYHRLRKRTSPELHRWDLIDLVNVAEDLGILRRGLLHLSHALREYRNLIHPGRQLRNETEVTEEEAEIAFNVVRACRRLLSGLGR